MKREVVLAASSKEGRFRVDIHEGDTYSTGVDLPLERLFSSIEEWQAWRRSEADPKELARIASTLSELLIPESVGMAIHSACHRAFNRKESLFFAIEAPDAVFASVPWELISVRKSESWHSLDGPLILDSRIRFFRKVSRSYEVSADAPPRVLVATANRGTATRGVLGWIEDEIEAVDLALPPSKVRDGLRICRQVGPASLEEMAISFRPTILHFAGHAERRATGGVLILCGAEDNEEKSLSAARLTALAKRAEISLIVLSACDSCGSSNGMAELLVAEGVPNVIAMQAPAYDACQVLFTRAFYGRIADGASVADAFTLARQSLIGTACAWAVPVLFTADPGQCPIPAPTRIRKPAGHNFIPSGGRFLGRDEELQYAKTQVSPQTLLTVVGPTGIGKTRFAQEVALSVASSFPDGVRRVVCSECSSFDELQTLVFEALAVETSGPPSRAQLEIVLSERRCLLILDAIDNLIEAGAAAEIEAFLKHPSVGIIATAQQAVHLADEKLIRLRPLAVEGSLSPAALLLLEEQGKSADSVSEDELEAAGDIGRLLEGMPLAIVLAARANRVLDAQILRKALREGKVEILDMEGELGRAISLAMRFTPAVQQGLLRKLCIFSGSFSMKDVESVFQENILNLLMQVQPLVERNLLVVEETGNGKRYRLLDIFRYHLIQNGAADEDLEVSFQHATRFLKVAGQAEADIRAGRWRRGGGLLWPNLGNIKASLRFFVKHRQGKQTLEMIDALSRTYLEAGLHSDLESMLVDGYRAAESTGAKAITAKLLGLEGAMAFRKNDPERGLEAWRRREALCHEIGDDLGAADAALDLAIQYIQEGELQLGIQLLDAAEGLLKNQKLPALHATITVIRARTLAQQKQFEKALELAKEASRLAVEANDRDSTLYVDLNLGRTWRFCGKLDLAEAAFLRLIVRGQEAGREVQPGVGALELSSLYEQVGRLDEAFLCALAADQIFAAGIVRWRDRSRDRLQDLRSRFSVLSTDRSPFLALPPLGLIAEILRRAGTSPERELDWWFNQEFLKMLDQRSTYRIDPEKE